MSKVQTLLKVISYQKEHPFSTDADISENIGISERYLRECKKELSLLSSHLSKPLLERSEVDFVLSKLSMNVRHEREIYLKLQRAYIGEKDGLIRIANENDRPSMEYLRIGLWAPKENRAHVDFFITYLLNDTLFFVDEEGEIDYRLAEICENTKGYKKWRLKIKKNLHWSDGKPITVYDVIDTVAKSRLAQEITELKKGNKEEILFTLRSLPCSAWQYPRPPIALPFWILCDKRPLPLKEKQTRNNLPSL